LVGTAVNVTPDPWHEGFAPAVILVVTPGVTLDPTVIVTAFDVAVTLEAHVAFEVRIHVTTSLFERVEVLKDELFVPILEPFICHWYAGVVPPFVITELKIGEAPLQIEAVLVEIAIVGVTAGVFAIEIVVELAVLVEAHAALEVRTQLITSLFANAELLKVELFVPVFVPFTCHW
jgi:hypothetical protein